MYIRYPHLRLCRRTTSIYNGTPQTPREVTRHATSLTHPFRYNQTEEQISVARNAIYNDLHDQLRRRGINVNNDRLSDSQFQDQMRSITANRKAMHTSARVSRDKISHDLDRLLANISTSHERTSKGGSSNAKRKAMDSAASGAVQRRGSFRF